jgi:hypothetical protein
MLDQRMRLVLGHHADAADTGIDAIGQGKIDDAELAAELHCGFGIPIRQIVQTAAATARQHQGHGIFGQCTDESW